MKEVLTKSFWQGVKKTFYEALEPQPATDDTSEAPAEGLENASSSKENPSLPSDSERTAVG